MDEYPITISTPKPAVLMTTACRSCGAPIVWAFTREGKRIPLDAKPEKRIVLDGTSLTCSLGNPTAPAAHVVDTYLTHFVTCPNAKQHRRAR